MDANRWAHVRSLFEGALELPLEAREAYVRDRCAGDADLCARVLALLDADAASHELFDGGHTAFDALGAAEFAEALPERVGPYRVVGEVGRGGMGVVYRAQRADGVFDRTVALKVIRGGFESEEVLRRFHQERRLLATLEHPNVARLYDAGVTERGAPYLVIEFVEGERIDRYCDARRLPVPDRIRLFRSVCDAVRHAHRSLVIHRDLKPSNILVAADGTAKLLDFGIAKPAGPETGDQPLTRSGLRLLTPEYASPEQIRGEALTTATDVYSLGVVLYELLTGRRPYGDWTRAVTSALTPDERSAPLAPSRAVTTASATLDDAGADVTATPAAVSALRNATPDRLRRILRGDLDRILLTALAPAVGDRYPSVEAFAEDLGRWLEGRPVRARAPSPAYRARKFVRRNRVGVATAMLVLMAIAGGSAVALQQARVAAAERDAALGVSRFLEELFSAPDPRVLQYHDTTRLIDFLEAAGGRVRTELADQPRARARLLLVLGITWRNIGRTDLAAPLLREALDASRVVHGERHEDVAEAQRILGISLAERDSLLEAIALLEAALATQRSLTGEESWEVARIHESLGQVLLRARQPERAAPHVEASLAIRRRVLEPDDPVIASSINTLASVKSMLGRDAEALPLYAEVVALHERNPRYVPADLAVNRMNLASVLIRAGRAREAVEQARLGQEILEKQYPDPFWVVALGRGRLAEALSHVWYESGDERTANEADSLFRSALAMLSRLPQAGRSRAVLHAYGKFLQRRGRLTEAESAMRQVLRLEERVLGPATAGALEVRSSLSSILLDGGRTAEAEQMAREAYDGLLVTHPPAHRSVLIAAVNLGRALTSSGKLEEAMALLAPTVDLAHGELGEDHPVTADARRAMDALVAMSEGRHAEEAPDS